MTITALCGVAHVLSSAAIGFIGVGAGLAVASVTPVEEYRASIATWLLIGFGLAYGTWGLWRGLKGRRHSHAHVHPDGTSHYHDHDHLDDHVHVHAERGNRRVVQALFIVFVLGPCEPLIPLLMYPAATHSWTLLAGVAVAFGATTVFTMVMIVAALRLGLGRVRLGPLERYVHALAGGVLAMSGLAVVVFDI